MANLRFEFLDKNERIDIEEEMGCDGCVTMPDWVVFADNRNRSVKIITNNIAFVENVMVVVGLIFAHPESGCAWAYVSLYENRDSHIRITIDCYDSIGIIDNDGVSICTDDINEELPF